MQTRLKRVRLLILDVDGVLTDGRIILDDRGRETKFFNARDGSGIKYLLRSGLQCAFISGRKSAAVLARAGELGVEQCYQDAKDKIIPYEKILQKFGFKDEEVAFMADDLTDLPLLRRVGLPVAVADAAQEVKEASIYITKRTGGRGAVRELIELILKAQGKWEEILLRYKT
ncbi:MAG: 3-deoxy-D-manno-octulosonate 8-phosphate phosphatase [Planctomycetes bacterium DG_23]|nr:MAG: 3-deoxy-D-manno-octulosonate 8-phosphate phosphatase [Planctomycetes bacterium DG_23]